MNVLTGDANDDVSEARSGDCDIIRYVISDDIGSKAVGKVKWGVK